MALLVADRVQETTTTTGTGDITLDGAVTGYQTFASALANGDTTYYTIADQTGSNWEVGFGTFTSPSTLARTTILSSSNSSSAVNFTAGTKNVFITYPAGRSVLSNSSGAVPVAAGGTSLSTLTANNVLLGNGTSAVQFVAPGTSGNLLTSNGSTWSSTAPTANTELNAMLYGDGSDGALTMAASGTVTLTRDQYYSSVAWPSASTAVFNPAGYRIFVSGTLDLTNAPAGAFARPGTSGGAGATAGTSGTGGSAAASATVGGSNLGNNGGAGGITTGSAGVGGVANAANGGTTGGVSSGPGGLGATGAGGIGTPGAVPLTSDIRIAKIDLLRGAALLLGGMGGSSGGGGGGDGTSGAGGGGGGAGGGVIAVFANTIQRGASSNAWFNANAGTGGNGGSATAGNRGGGGAGMGGGGGWVFLVFNILLGTVNTNAIVANGGNGGTGGNGFGTGVGGNGGGGGGGGRATRINALTGVTTVSVGTAGGAGGAASGVTGGSAGTGTTLTASL